MLRKLFYTNLPFKKFVKKASTKYLSMCKEQQISIAGQCINYIKTGNGEHALLCFPGALGTIWSDFKPQIENLNKDKFTVVAWDPPGYGLSRPPNRNFTTKFYENDADTAYEFMKALGLKDYSLLGWSDGAVSSIIMAAKYPHVINKLVLWGGNAYLAEEDLAAMNRVSNIDDWSDRMKAPLIAIYGEELLKDMWSNWHKVMKSINRENRGNLCKDILCLIKCPTLILHGDKDPMIAPEHPDYLLKNIKGALLHRFPEGKHNIHIKYATEFNNLVTKFLTEQNKL